MALVRARSSGATLLRWGGTRSARTGGPARHASALTRHDSCMGTIEHEAEYLAHNYHPLPVVLTCSRKVRPPRPSGVSA